MRRSDRAPWWRRLLLDLVVIAGVTFAVTAWQGRHLLRVHTAAPPVELTALDGTRVSLANLRGKRVMLHFWATWCGVCRQEFSALNAVHAGLAPDEALFAIVADAEDPAHVRSFVAERHLEYPVLLGTPDVLRAFRVDTFPTSYFLDKSGKIASRTVGMSTRFAIRARLALAN